MCQTASHLSLALAPAQKATSASSASAMFTIPPVQLARPAADLSGTPSLTRRVYCRPHLHSIDPAIPLSHILRQQTLRGAP